MKKNILIQDNANNEAPLSECIFEEIAESVLTNLKDRRGIGQELEDVEYNDPEIYKGIVEQTANTIHKGITDFVKKEYFKGDETKDMKILSVNEAREELNKLFERNMEIVAAS